MVRRLFTALALAVLAERAGIPPGVELAAYRVLQEALTNVLRHAGRTTVRARVEVGPTAVVVEVVDAGARSANGRVLTGAGAGHGLLGMRYRVEAEGGRFALESRPGHGTRIHATLPLRSSAAQSMAVPSADLTKPASHAG